MGIKIQKMYCSTFMVASVTQHMKSCFLVTAKFLWMVDIFYKLRICIKGC